LGSLLGLGVGLVAEKILLKALVDVLPDHIAVSRISAWLASIVLGNATLMVFALPAVLDLRNMSPLGILQGKPMPSPGKRRLSYVIGLSLMIGVLLWHTGNMKMMLSTLLIGAGAMAILAFGAYLILLALRQLNGPFPIAMRLGIRRLFRHPSRTLIQLMGFSLTFAVLTLVTSLREELVNDWMAHLPSNAPNFLLLTSSTAICLTLRPQCRN